MSWLKHVETTYQKTQILLPVIRYHWSVTCEGDRWLLTWWFWSSLGSCRGSGQDGGVWKRLDGWWPKKKLACHQRRVGKHMFPAAHSCICATLGLGKSTVLTVFPVCFQFPNLRQLLQLAGFPTVPALGNHFIRVFFPRRNVANPQPAKPHAFAWRPSRWPRNCWRAIRWPWEISIKSGARWSGVAAACGWPRWGFSGYGAKRRFHMTRKMVHSYSIWCVKCIYNIYIYINTIYICT